MSPTFSLPSRVHRQARPQAASDSGWYAVYATLLVAVVVGAPLVRAVSVGLSSPDVLPLLLDPPSALLPTVLVAALATASAVGGSAGPAVLNPFLTVHLGGNHLSRARTLLRPFLLSAGLLMAACGLVAGTVAWTLWRVHAIDALVGASMLLVTVCAAWLCSVVWLAGQACSVRARTVLVLAAAVAAATVPLLPIPWSTPVGTVTWTVSAALSCLAVPRLLVRLRGGDLLTHARRRDLARAAGASGEVGQALATFRPLPRVGRRLDAVRTSGLFLLTIVRRDLIGALRTPTRAVVGALGIVASGLLLVLALDLPAAVLWPPAAAAAVVGFASLGVVSDGFRYAAEGAGRPPLHGVSPAGLMTAHGALPGLLVVLASACASVCGVLAGASAAAIPLVFVCSALLVLVRACDSARGPLPVRLLTPVQSPVGDFAGAVVVLWQVEALVLSLVLTIGLAYAVSATPWALGSAPLIAAVLVLRTRRRLRAE